MYTSIFTFTFLIISLCSFGKDTQKVKDKKTNEEYYVLRSDNSIKHGSYKKLFKNDIILEGYYTNGLKDSIWTEYFFKHKISQGYYHNDIKVGVWEYFDNDTLVQKYDASKTELLFYKPNPKEVNKEFNVLINYDTSKIKLDRPPLYLGGDIAIFNQIWHDLKYPKTAVRDGIMGTVIICFMIDKNGKTFKHSIKNGIGGGCDEEALRVVIGMEEKWIPGILNGEKIDVVYELPIVFELSDR